MTAAPPAAPAGPFASLDREAARSGVHTAAVLTDPAVAGARVVSAVTERLRGAGCAVETREVGTGGAIDDIRRLADQAGSVDLVVAVGGGTVIDQAKLAATLPDNPGVAARLGSPQRSGSLVLPPGTERRVGLVVVPTTLGTGSERGVAACFSSPRGKRIVEGLCLRPDAWTLLAEATETLPTSMVADGVLEALFRTVSPYAGDHADLPAQDTAAEATAVRLVRAGDETARLRRDGAPVPAGLRLRIAELSGYSHSADLLANRPLYPAKGWPLANELSWELGLRKITAVAALLPPLWRRIADGDRRLGNAERLQRIWRAIRRESPGLPHDPADGIAALAAAWGVESRIVASPERIDAAAARAVRAWGAGLPMLAGFTRPEVYALFADCAGAHTAPPAPAPPKGPPPDRRRSPTERRLPEPRLRNPSPTTGRE